MTYFRLATGRKKDGSPYTCFLTWDVCVGDRVVGMVQCKGPCFGPTATVISPTNLKHKHGPWIAFGGSDSEVARNLPGLYDTADHAARAILEEAHG